MGSNPRHWKQFKGKAKEQWGKLTADDLDVGRASATSSSAASRALCIAKSEPAPVANGRSTTTSTGVKLRK